jgi:competence protein ComEA
MRFFPAIATLVALSFGFAFAADDEADRLPPGPGRQTLVKVCGECHGYEGIRKLRMSKDDWDQKISDMVVNGAKGTNEELADVLDYLTKTFGPDSKIWVNTAPFSELKAILKLSNEETDALIAYRTKSGPFKSWQDVAKAPGVDPAKVEAAKDKMAF